MGRGYGVADFDIHFFYRQNPAKSRLSRAVKRFRANISYFNEAPIDFVRTVMPARFCASHNSDPEGLLRAFLQRQPTCNAYHLAQQAIVGLIPDTLFGKVIWG